jgi:ATP-dependent RNA helicase DeaD
MERKKVLEIKLFKGKSKDKPSRDGEKKSFGFKGKSSFAKKKKSKPNGFTNNPKYFERKPSENTSSDSEKKSFSFKGKKKFKSRNSRPKNFSFKKHSKKRARS